MQNKNPHRLLVPIATLAIGCAEHTLRSPGLRWPLVSTPDQGRKINTEIAATARQVAACVLEVNPRSLEPQGRYEKSTAIYADGMGRRFGVVAVNFQTSDEPDSLFIAQRSFMHRIKFDEQSFFDVGLDGNPDETRPFQSAEEARTKYHRALTRTLALCRANRR